MKYSWIFSVFVSLLLVNDVSALTFFKTKKQKNCEPPLQGICKVPEKVGCEHLRGRGWSLDLGGQYSWMQLTTPPTFSGNTGGARASLAYQKPSTFYGQIRSIYNISPLKHSNRNIHDTESYTEILGGYAFSYSDTESSYWSFAPYGGVGLDFLNDHESSFGSGSSTKFKYQTYYALAGLDVRYATQNWYIAAQGECLPVFQEYVSVSGERGMAWKLDKRLGYSVRIPWGWRLGADIWAELAPYARLLPIGTSSVRGLPSRDLRQYGVFLSVRFFL